MSNPCQAGSLHRHIHTFDVLRQVLTMQPWLPWNCVDHSDLKVGEMPSASASPPLPLGTGITGLRHHTQFAVADLFHFQVLLWVSEMPDFPLS